MITIENHNSEEPYKIFYNYYKKALERKQKNIEAIHVSSYDKKLDEVQSRIVNLKYIIHNEWIFFTNYLSPKSKSFEFHDQIAALFFWDAINLQIRIKAKIKKTNSIFSDKHFKSRSKEKNIVSVISNQSKKINSHELLLEKYDSYDKGADLLRPDYWGGFSFVPFYFEFWTGNDNRLNKRDVFELTDQIWQHSILEP